MENKEYDFKKYLKSWKEEKFVENLPEEIYHAEEALSSGQLSAIINPDYGIHRLFAEKTLGLKKEATEAQSFGSKFHKAVLERDEFLRRYKVVPEFTGLTKDGRPSTQSAEAKAKKAAWYADQPKDAIIVESAEERDQLSGMLESLLKHKEAADLLKGGITELSGFFNLNGFRCRTRVDIFREDINTIIDLKTTRNAYSQEFEKQIVKNFYFIQAWLYLAGAIKITKRKNMKFKFIAVEKEPPYLVTVQEIGESMLTCGDILANQAMSKLNAAINSGVWLPEPQMTYMAEAPEWMLKKLEGQV